MTTIGVLARGCRCTPRATKKNFLGILCWNEAKMGMNLVGCIPADEIKGSWWQYMTYMTT